MGTHVAIQGRQRRETLTAPLLEAASRRGVTVMILAVNITLAGIYGEQICEHVSIQVLATGKVQLTKIPDSAPWPPRIQDRPNWSVGKTAQRSLDHTWVSPPTARNTTAPPSHAGGGGMMANDHQETSQNRIDQTLRRVLKNC